MLSGANIIGGNPKDMRVSNDWYATPPQAVDKLLDAIGDFHNIQILEPAVGSGNIASVINERGGGTNNITGIDIVDRGYPGTIVTDFLKYKTDKKYDVVITNPPFLLSSEFIKHGFDLLTDHGQLILFLKIQFLECEKRKEIFDNYPLKYVYVFRKRVSCWNNGIEKKQSATMCFCWFIWEVGYKGEPVIRWL